MKFGGEDDRGALGQSQTQRTVGGGDLGLTDEGITDRDLQEPASDISSADEDMHDQIKSIQQREHEERWREYKGTCQMYLAKQTSSYGVGDSEIKETFAEIRQVFREELYEIVGTIPADKAVDPALVLSIVAQMMPKTAQVVLGRPGSEFLITSLSAVNLDLVSAMTAFFSAFIFKEVFDKEVPFTLDGEWSYTGTFLKSESKLEPVGGRYLA